MARASDAPYKVTPSLSFAFSKEQARDASGAATDQFTAHRQLAVMSTFTRELWPFLDAGVFFLAEHGARTLIGGGPADYTLFWIGPTVRGVWRALFLEISYVLFGVREDHGLASVASSAGDTTSAFRTDPSRAWLLTPGVTFALSDALEGVVRIEYRFHYYDARGGAPLAGGGAVGSQAIRPHLGVQWRL